MEIHCMYKEKIIFSFSELLPNVYHLKFSDMYTSNMCFWRYSEYNESYHWQSRVPTLVEYMDWYAKEHSSIEYCGVKGKIFSYPGDWSGFNIPSSTFDALIPLSGDSPIRDWNEYDSFMKGIVTLSRLQSKSNKFYLIGTCEEDDESEATLLHELSHALYYIDTTYQKTQLDILYNSTTTRWRTQLCKILGQMMYSSSVYEDEMIAYMSTGEADEMKKISKTKQWISASESMSIVLRDTLKKITPR